MPKVLPGPLTDLSATVDENPQWARTLPSLIYFSWDIYREPPLHKKKSYIKADI
jgi:hypothetical protein